MADNLVHTRHTVSGQIGDVPESFLTHSVLGPYLEVVDEDAKPYLPEMHKPREAAVVDHDDPDEDLTEDAEAHDDPNEDLTEDAEAYDAFIENKYKDKD